MSGYTTTPNYGLYKPTINADNDQWGNHLNANADTLDTTLKTIQNSAGVTTWNTRAGAVILTGSDVTTVLPPSSTTPSMDGTAAVGTATTWARADHVHPTDTGIAAAAAAAGHNVGRNLLHNPLFNVAQRGAGPWTVAGNYTLDRWSIQVAAPDTVSVAQVLLSDTNRANIGDEAAVYCLGSNFVGSASGHTHLEHGIESIRRLAGKTVTVSFWANAGAALKLGINILQNFGTGGSPSANLWVLATGASVTIPGTTFARYSTTIAIPSIAGKTLGTAGNDCHALAFWYSSGAGTNALAGNIGVQSGIINIWGVQLEIGSVATPLEKPDPRYDLANCQRFFCITGLRTDAATPAGAYGVSSSIALPVTMRSTPTLAQTANASANVTGITYAANNNGVVTVAGSTGAGGGGYAIVVGFSASADL